MIIIFNINFPLIWNSILYCLINIWISNELSRIISISIMTVKILILLFSLILIRIKIWIAIGFLQVFIRLKLFHFQINSYLRTQSIHLRQKQVSWLLMSSWYQFVFILRLVLIWLIIFVHEIFISAIAPALMLNSKSTLKNRLSLHFHIQI